MTWCWTSSIPVWKNKVVLYGLLLCLPRFSFPVFSKCLDRPRGSLKMQKGSVPSFCPVWKLFNCTRRIDCLQILVERTACCRGLEEVYRSQERVVLCSRESKHYEALSTSKDKTCGNYWGYHFQKRWNTEAMRKRIPRSPRRFSTIRTDAMMA